MVLIRGYRLSYRMWLSIVVIEYCYRYFLSISILGFLLFFVVGVVAGCNSNCF